ncbi:ethanolamine ammonia-lyase subunit EutB [Gynuella sunshinyii]|uniref:Ethanolamine ammonia-lyase large subunit n=1 Tax=Gynuella sunshinyii YC6258 TaxID=1445510 RepID=A0A0C5VSW3_9GAMM|nr:ethanolamine ammonia-lyase subunit EutB [Gynuella sunshinyii]AJQ97271.1 ethanolamine ammonia-lyase, large subunit [Gynuella sunshinyii YC6258]
MYHCLLDSTRWTFPNLKVLMAKATPRRSGDELAGIAAESELERVAAQICLSEVFLEDFLDDVFIPYQQDEVTRLILDNHDAEAFRLIAGLTVGEFREFLLAETTTPMLIQQLKWALTPEMASAVSKIMRIQDLILVGQKCHNVASFRNTIGRPGCLSVRLQPNHPTDDEMGIAASMMDGLLMGCGDAVIGINPASDNPATVRRLLALMDGLIQEYQIPTQSCVLTHVTTTIDLINQGAPVDLIFQSIAGTQKANESFGINLALLKEAREAGDQLARGTVGNNCMYFETGQGSALSANAHHGVDQQTCEARAYAVARQFDPLLINSVVGFIGPEYLYDGKQIIRAGLEDLFCGKLLGLPMGCDICYTNHAQADQDDMDMLLTQFAVAGGAFIMGIPGSDDVMLNYQTTSFHDALYIRRALNLTPAPEFADWLKQMSITDDSGRVLDAGIMKSPFLSGFSSKLLGRIE